MSTYNTVITWHRNGANFTDNRYSRAHKWQFDGGAELPASSSPHVVPLPYSDPEGVDPEEAFLASISSCHMLWFLSIAAKKGFVVDEYRDNAEAFREKNSEGKLAITKVILQPDVKYLEDSTPSPEENDDLHHEAHEKCFIANSIRTDVKIQPILKK